ncbi:ABC transporter substrate-binding protein [Paenibacillus alkalitolerans]|uniref:ABC transporter substrate-binding protein n=1 Tax=Paenibacillus alkalitolerans TaxID=2799335 RepID=UPI0018F7500D|nr:sugar ABC transporter substrate-binding protein [Paenibacillus alkalitolerans]
MTKFKKIATLMMAALLTFAMAACGGASSESGGNTGSGGNAGSGGSAGEAASPGGDEKPITLRVAWWGGQSRHDATLKVIEMYEEQNPHVKIQPEFSSYDGYWEKMAAQAAGKNLPDVMNQNFGEYLTQYTEKGLLADLTPFIESGLIDTTNISQSILDSGTLNGKIVGLSLGTNAYMAMYDPALFEKAGAEKPKLGWTWSDVEDAARKLKTVAEYGVDTLETHRVVEIWLREHGGRYFNDDGTGLGYTDDKILEDYFTMHQKWVKEGLAPKLDVKAQHDSTENSMIVLGKLGLTFTWSNGIGAHAKAAQRPLDIAPMPGPNETKGMYLKPSMFFSIPESSENKEEAAKFISFFVNNVEANKILNADRGVPVSSVVADALKSTVDESTAKTFDYIKLLTENSSPIDGNHPATAAEVLKVLTETDEKVLYEQLTPQEAAKEFRKKAEEILSRK